AVQTAREIRDGCHRAVALAALAAQLPAVEQRQELAREAVRAAQPQYHDGSAFGNYDGLLNTMATLARLLPDGEREEDARLAGHGPGSGDRGWRESEAMANLARLLPEEERQKVAHQAIHQAQLCGENDLVDNIAPAMVALMPFLPEGERRELAASVFRDVGA